MNNLLPLDLKFSKKVTTVQIKSLGNLIGDALWLLEVEMIKKSGNRVERPLAESPSHTTVRALSHTAVSDLC